MAERGMLLEAAKRMVEAAEKKAIEINVPMVITVCDMGGNLVLGADEVPVLGEIEVSA